MADPYRPDSPVARAFVRTPCTSIGSMAKCSGQAIVALVALHPGAWHRYLGGMTGRTSEGGVVCPGKRMCCSAIRDYLGHVSFASITGKPFALYIKMHSGSSSHTCFTEYFFVISFTRCASFITAAGVLSSFAGRIRNAHR